jgi:hypothetical protein
LPISPTQTVSFFTQLASTLNKQLQNANNSLGGQDGIDVDQNCASESVDEEQQSLQRMTEDLLSSGIVVIEER